MVSAFNTATSATAAAAAEPPPSPRWPPNTSSLVRPTCVCVPSVCRVCVFRCVCAGCLCVVRFVCVCVCRGVVRLLVHS